MGLGRAASNVELGEAGLVCVVLSLHEVAIFWHEAKSDSFQATDENNKTEHAHCTGKLAADRKQTITQTRVQDDRHQHGIGACLLTQPRMQPAKALAMNKVRWWFGHFCFDRIQETAVVAIHKLCNDIKQRTPSKRNWRCTVQLQLRLTEWNPGKRIDEIEEGIGR